jgi:hypothetical protein
MGITAYEDTFNSKNTYENILTGINKEGAREFERLKTINSAVAHYTPYFILFVFSVRMIF